MVMSSTLGIYVGGFVPRPSYKWPVEDSTTLLTIYPAQPSSFLNIYFSFTSQQTIILLICFFFPWSFHFLRLLFSACSQIFHIFFVFFLSTYVFHLFHSLLRVQGIGARFFLSSSLYSTNIFPAEVFSEMKLLTTSSRVLLFISSTSALLIPRSNITVQGTGVQGKKLAGMFSINTKSHPHN